MKFSKIALISAIVMAMILSVDGYAKQTAGPRMVEAIEPMVSSPAAQVEEVVKTEREKITQTIIDTEAIKAAATVAINQAKQQLANGEISTIEAAKIIGENKYKIKQAEELLAALVGQSVANVEAADSYLGRFIAGAYDIGQRILAPFRAGYGYTEEEKGIARAIIAELQQELNDIAQEYKANMKRASSNEKKSQLTNDFNMIKDEFENEIYHQQLITGDVMSTNRKLFWSAVGLAGAVAGGAMAKQYFGTEAAEEEKSVIKEGVKELIKTEPMREELEKELGKPTGGVIITPGIVQEATGKAAELGERALERYLAEQGGLEEHGAPQGESYLERAQATAESPEAYRKRVEKATSKFGKGEAELGKQPRETVSAEEQRQRMAEAGEKLAEKATRATKYIKGLPERLREKEQLREEPTGVTITPEMTQEAEQKVIKAAGKAAELGEIARERYLAEQGGLEEHGAPAGEESWLEKVSKPEVLKEAARRSIEFGEKAAEEYLRAQEPGGTEVYERAPAGIERALEAAKRPYIK